MSPTPEASPDPVPYRDVRRAGLNPAADYGGNGDVAWRQAGNKVIRAVQESGLVEAEEGQLSFLDAAGDIKPELEVKGRAKIGSAAIRGVSAKEASAPTAAPDTYGGEGRSAAAARAMRAADQVWLVRHA